MPSRKASEIKVQVRDIREVNGEVNIAAGDIYKGYTPRQVSVLLKQITTTFQPKKFDGSCPYKGLDVFEEEDAELFFGREKLLEDLVRQVKESRTLFITGPSGSGKSSLVRAGLIHALKEGKLKNSRRWLYGTMKPGRDPIVEIGRVTSSLAGTTKAGDEIHRKARKDKTIFARWCEIALKEGREKRAVIFIDQFEEVFTQVSKEEDRVAFLNLITHAATVENGRVILLFSMRSDFLSNCATYPKLNGVVNAQFVQIGAMQEEELVNAIAQPALRVGLRIDPDLIAQIINEMRGEPGSLPLMQFALKDLFDSQQAQEGLIALKLNDYLQRGGIRKALERHADETFTEFSPQEQELARSIFTGLIEIGRGTVDTRRTAIFDELVPADAKAEDVEAIVRKLADARLITTDEIAGKDTVTISHEKLIDAWPWLKKLVNDNRDVIALQNEIAEDAKEWDEHGRDASYLYAGARLVKANEELRTNKLVLSGTALEYVRAGQARQRQSRWALIGAMSTVIAFLILAVIVFRWQSIVSAQNALEAQRQAAIAEIAVATAQAANTLSVAQAQEAKKQASIARAGELSSLALLEIDRHFDLSLLLGVEGFRTVNTSHTQGTLLTLADSHPGLQVFLSGLRSGVNSVVFSPNGKRLASGGWDSAVILWDVSNPIAPSQLATMTGHSGQVFSVAFSPVDGGKLLASGDGDGAIILWDISDPQNPSNLATLSGHSDRVLSVAFSPDGKRLASGSLDTTTILWDISDPQKPFKLVALPGDGSQVNSVVFDPLDKAGNLLASVGSEGVTLWDVSDLVAPSPVTLSGTDQVLDVAFSPDGKRLAAGSSDQSVLLWDVSDPRHPSQLGTLIGHKAAVSTVAFSPDGNRLASGSWDTSIKLWDVSDPSAPYELTTLSGYSYGLLSVAFSPDGKRLASSSGENAIILWDVSAAVPVPPVRLSTQSQESFRDPSVAISQDRKLQAATDGANTIILADVSDPNSPSQLSALSAQSGVVKSVAFSPDGKLLASGSSDYSITLWDINDPKKPFELATLAGHLGDVNSLAFSPDGKRLASGSSDHFVILWDVSNPKKPFKIATLAGHGDGVYSVAFSPNGQRLASGSYDKNVILWDVSDPRSPSQLATLSGSSDGVIGLTFSSDGKQLLSSSLDGSSNLWDLDVQSWVKSACQRAGRNLTRAEWTQYITDKPYPTKQEDATCPQWPLELEVTSASTAAP